MPTYFIPGRAGGTADYDALNRHSRWLEETGQIGGGGRSSTYTPNYAPYGAAPYSSGPIGAGSSPASVTAANIAAQQAANQARIPGAAGMEEQSSKMIEQQLLGEVPSDVLNVLGQGAAERGIATGMPGSGNMNAAYLRALGLTSVGQQQQGQQNLSAAYARNPGGQVMNAESMVITPLQQAQLDLQRYQAETGRISATRSSGGGGGGGYTPQTSGTGTGGYIPASTLFGSGRGGYTFSKPPESVPVTYSSTPGTNFTYGYQPTSSGSMYMGSFEDYNPAPANTITSGGSSYYDYTGGLGGWGNEYYGGN